MAPEARSRAPLSFRLGLVFGLLANAGLAILLIAVAGFVFQEPEGARGEMSAVLGWGSALGICLLSPALGLWLWRAGHRGAALAMAWLPPVAFLLGALAMI